MARRIVSLLPAATEMVCALGRADDLVGITHECDYPAEIHDRPVVVRNAIPLEGLTPREIDESVAARLGRGESIYAVDEALLRSLEPDLIITQDLCQVCAPSGNEVSRVVNTLPRSPEILSFTPKSLADVYTNIEALGIATGAIEPARRLVAAGRGVTERITAITSTASHRPRVFCMEWFDPVYCSGHWIPEMVELAGGRDRLARKWADSARVSWEAVCEWAPEILVLMPCGLSLDRVAAQAANLSERDGWSRIPAVRDQRVYAVDANSYFARPGPRLVDGTELLAHLFHPELVPWLGPAGAFKRLDGAGSPKTAPSPVAATALS
ncbi:MAG TPA: cobalamin-binding protein [Vicinamibacterales bacterium]